MADIFARDGSGQGGRPRYASLGARVEVVVLSDAPAHDNIRVLHSGRDPLLCQRVTLVLRVNDPTIGLVEGIKIAPADNSVNDVAYEDFAAICTFKVMTTAEYEERHGCPSSTPN